MGVVRIPKPPPNTSQTTSKHSPNTPQTTPKHPPNHPQTSCFYFDSGWVGSSPFRIVVGLGRAFVGSGCGQGAWGRDGLGRPNLIGFMQSQWYLWNATTGYWHDVWNSIKQSAKGYQNGKFWRSVIRFSSIANLRYVFSSRCYLIISSCWNNSFACPNTY